jgi:hypothetical protein
MVDIHDKVYHCKNVYMTDPRCNEYGDICSGSFGKYGTWNGKEALTEVEG